MSPQADVVGVDVRKAMQNAGAVIDAYIVEVAGGSDCTAAMVSEQLEAARAAVAELIEADMEYEKARRDWDHVTAHDPEETSDETWRRVADRFERAVMRRAAALAAATPAAPKEPQS